MKNVFASVDLMGTKRLLVEACDLPVSIGRLVLIAAKAGRTLPRLSVLLVLQLCIHFVYIQTVTLPPSFVQASFGFICLNAALNVAGYVLLVALYRCSVQKVFNRQIPPTIRECLPSFGVHLSMLRPLEILFRYCTSSFRVLPDIIVLGEVRCGTTSFCQHLAQLEFFDCHTPFCLWAHPELDNKETFFFVGHYLGRVTPRHYRMCFPLKATKWWNDCYGRLRGLQPKPFLSFDGCAQYLSSPTAPHLIAQAYRDAGQPPPVLIACVRNPAEQAMSWWKYENSGMLLPPALRQTSAMKWSEEMCLRTWNFGLRGMSYPPKTIKQAFAYSNSTRVRELYLKAEQQVVADLKNRRDVRLPPWAMTWPGGQLSVFGRNSKFAQNIGRYEKAFQCFDSTQAKGQDSSAKYVNILPMNWLGDDRLLKNFVVRILLRAAKRASDGSRYEQAIALFQKQTKGLSTVHRNAGSSADVNAELSAVQPLFQKDQDELDNLLKVNNIKLDSKRK
eukprot:scaffold11977_cov107-Cylindrotheca_fusiformis.AAC.4